MEIKVKQEGADIIFQLSGSLDTNTSPEVEGAILKAMQKNPSIIIDMTNIPYVSSAGLRVILTLHKKAAKAGGRFALHNPTVMAIDLFDMTGFKDFLNFV